MKQTIAAIRALTALYIRTFVTPIAIIGASIVAILFISIGLLAHYVSTWWWLLGLPLLLITVVGLFAGLLVRSILRRISPKLTRQQATATRQLIAKLQSLSNTAHTPYPFVVFRIVRDVIRRKDQGYLYNLTQNSQTLRQDFDSLRRLF